MGIATAAMVLAPAALLARDGDRTRDVARAVVGGKAKNVILFIGDGTGEQELTLARNYTVGAAGRLAIDTLPLTGDMTTYSVLESDPSTPDYVGESAATASAFSTGRKTADGRISTTPGTDLDVPTTLELAEAAGYSTGNVTTADITDATPAAAMSHVSVRRCQGPLDMALCPQDRRSAGGPGSIAEQSLDKGIEVLLGGGRNRYQQVIPAGEPNAGKTLEQVALEAGYTYVTDRAGLADVDTGQQVLGLFHPTDMSRQWAGPQAAPGAGTPRQRCVEDQRPASEPSLAEMTSKAIELLDGGRGAKGSGQSKGRTGFFLQVESASIDKAIHRANACEAIGETVNLDEAVGVALDYAHEHPDTLVIVTGDHAMATQVIEVGPEQPMGFSSTLITDEGADLRVHNGTSTNVNFQEHTGTQIRVAAKGPQAANVVGLIDETDIFRIITRALGL